MTPFTCDRCGAHHTSDLDVRKTSGNRIYCSGGCKPRIPVAKPRYRAPVLDSYEQECEDEGIKMGYRSY